jgi:hypothetical protein
MSEDLDTLSRAYAAILEEARGHVAARRDPNAASLEARIRAAAMEARADGDPAEVDGAERQALQQLARIVSVHRARARMTREAAPQPAAAPLRRRAQLRARPTITGNMEVRRTGTATLVWDPASAVTEWEVRFSERPDPRRDYVVLETLTLPATATSVDVPLGDRPLRVHLLGRSRDGRLQRRALISALTREGWDDRWERRASAS